MVMKFTNLNECREEQIKDLLNSIDSIITDCDGVLWLENEIIKDSPETINKFIQLNKKVMYVTNNSTKTREDCLEKFKKLGYKATIENIFSGAYLAARYFKEQGFNRSEKKVYVIGSEGLIRELDKHGIKHTEIGPDVVDTNLETYVSDKLELDPQVGAVLVGFDSHFSYPKMVKAATYLKNPMCHFISVCPDETFPTSTPYIFPGTGCFTKCLEAASNREALGLGKPHKYLTDIFEMMFDYIPSRTLVIGDRCNTDILFGKRCGYKTLLVLSGVTSMSTVRSYSHSSSPNDHYIVPDFVINKLGDLLPYL